MCVHNWVRDASVSFFHYFLIDRSQLLLHTEINRQHTYNKKEHSYNLCESLESWYDIIIINYNFWDTYISTFVWWNCTKFYYKVLCWSYLWIYSSSRSYSVTSLLQHFIQIWYVAIFCISGYTHIFDIMNGITRNLMHETIRKLTGSVLK